MTMDKYIMNFVIGQAFIASTQRVYVNNRKNLLSNSKIKDILIDHVNSILTNGFADFYKTAIAINTAACTISNNFTFGIIQKLINITCEYMYIINYQNFQKRSNFNGCHCPMDRKMLRIVISELSKYPFLCNSLSPNNFKDIKKKLSNVSWSKLVFNNNKQNGTYDLYQDCIQVLTKHEGISPIEYDYKYWN